MLLDSLTVWQIVRSQAHKRTIRDTGTRNKEWWGEGRRGHKNFRFDEKSCGGILFAKSGHQMF